jgi:hypothetical protein
MNRKSSSTHLSVQHLANRHYKYLAIAVAVFGFLFICPTGIFGSFQYVTALSKSLRQIAA